MFDFIRNEAHSNTTKKKKNVNTHVGIYFTTNVDYAAKVYAAAAEKDGILLILSWVFVGNIYPVTEMPSAAISLAGKPVVVG